MNIKEELEKTMKNTILEVLLNVKFNSFRHTEFVDKNYFPIKENDILIKYYGRRRKKVCLVLWNPILQRLCLYFDNYFIPLIQSNYIQDDYTLVQKNRMLGDTDKRIINKIYRKYKGNEYI